MQRLNKTTTLLTKISNQEIYPESKILSDPGLNELFSWHTSRSARARIKDTLRLLVNKQLISQGSLNNQALYSITPAGRARLALVKLRISPQASPTVWAQRWHFVTYQIPETHKAARNQLISELKRIGLLRFGPALWIYPHDATLQIKKIANHLKVAAYLEYIRADTISQPKVWLQRFKLY